jgi:hypothetical protein
MPKDTVWLDGKGNYILIDTNTSIIIDSTFLDKDFLLQKGNEYITFSYTGKNSPKGDSILHILMSTQRGSKDTIYTAEKSKFDNMGNNIVVLLLIGLVLVIRYALKKKREYVKDPIAAEAKEDWEYIGNSRDGGY